MMGLTAGVVMAVIGSAAACTTVTGGRGRVDGAEAPAYRSSVAVSVSESAATSSMRESERQATLTTEAIHTACETLSTTSAEAVDTVNVYVDAVNGQGDPVAAEGPAAEALHRSADTVLTDVNDTLPQAIHDALSAWVDAARATADAVTGRVPPGEFNDAVDKLNDARSHALDLCDATY